LGATGIEEVVVPVLGRELHSVVIAHKRIAGITRVSVDKERVKNLKNTNLTSIPSTQNAINWFYEVN